MALLNERLTSFVVVFITFFSITFPEEQVRCPNQSKCVPLSQCKINDADMLIYPCHSGLNMICCPSNLYMLNTTSSTSLKNRKTSLFPVNCGVIMTSDKISGGKTADLGQFPWMALLGYRQRQVDITQFLCGGSVVTESYIITAAHCINLDRRLELVSVRLGEHDLLKNVDCVEIENTKDCADPPVNYDVERAFIHPKFDTQKLQNDIALIKVRQKIRFTDYIKPVCLPFERGLENRNLAKQKFTVSGWGKTNANNLGGSTTLQFATVTVWDHSVCAKNVPPEVKPISNNQLCANGPSKEDACRGDSGGPLVNATVDADRELRYFQVGVVSFASTLTCGDPSLPTVYTRLDKYLQWIEENVS